MPQGPLFSRRAGVTAAVVIVLIFLGCMSLGGDTHVEVVAPEAQESPNPNLVADGMLEQDGRATIPGGSEQDVYYPIPFFGPPNLVLTGDTNYVKLISQRRDHFRVKNVSDNTHFQGSIHWQAKGVKALVLAPGATLNAPPLRGLPGEPVPVSQP